MTLPEIQIQPRDLSAYRAGNTGIPYVHRFDSGRPGPHLLVNALTHGNEFCGMVAACHLMDSGIRPLIGTLTISFANVAAYESFDPTRPFDSRQIEHNLNRIWSSDWLDGSHDSVELRRARELRPAVAAADHILDIHSTSNFSAPFWVYADFERNGEMAQAIGLPTLHLVMPGGLQTGTPLVQHGRHGQATAEDQGIKVGAGVVVECGQHFLLSSGELAIEVSLRFLSYFGLLARPMPKHDPQQRFELLQTWVVRTSEFRFAKPLVGFERFAKDELIAVDGSEEIRAPCDDCTILMPVRVPVVGREGVYLARPLA